MNNGEVGGSRGRGRGWLNPENNQPKELRRPKTVSEDVKVELSKSKLSADAKEWYPPNYVAPTSVTYTSDPTPYRLPRSSVQDRIRQAQDQDPYTFNNMSYSLEETENTDLRENIAHLINVMCEITLDPFKFDTLCGPLVDSFAPTLDDVNLTRPLVEAIVNQSIAEANFRYNGARLCSIYDSLEMPEQSTFRACLLERCSAEENKIISGVETSEESMRGFAMFLAEIYTQLEDNQVTNNLKDNEDREKAQIVDCLLQYVSSKRGRIKSLGESLCKVLTHLLDTDKEVNIKAVCQLLKLSGLALDADCPGSMIAAFERLARRSELACVRGVMALRAARWGLADSEPLPAPVPAPALAPRRPPVANGESEGGYLADGQALTAEECAFLQNNLPPKPPTLDDDILDELDHDAWDTGMDEEMQESYLEFLKLSNQIRR